MPTVTVTTCSRCGRTHDPRWRAGIRFVVTRFDAEKSTEKALLNMDDACRWCASALERVIGDFAAKFTKERKPRKKEMVVLADEPELRNETAEPAPYGDE